MMKAGIRMQKLGELFEVKYGVNLTRSSRLPMESISFPAPAETMVFQRGSNDCLTSVRRLLE